jgi:hypothetical protein
MVISIELVSNDKRLRQHNRQRRKPVSIQDLRAPLKYAEPGPQNFKVAAPLGRGVQFTDSGGENQILPLRQPARNVTGLKHAPGTLRASLP